MRGLDPLVLGGLRAILDPLRIRVLGRVLSRPAAAETIAADLGLTVVALNRALDPLVAAGVVERRSTRGGTLIVPRADRVGDLARELARLGGQGPDAEAGLLGEWPHEGEPPAETIARVAPTPEDAKLIRSYLRDGRLTTIPAQARKRVPILRFLAERVFTEDRGYPEKEVNQRLALFHRDVAALRRYLVDEGMVVRDDAGTSYRRAPES